MIRTITITLLALLCLLTANDLRAQDPIFSQFYAAPLQINPAFAGNTYTPRIALNYRNQWNGWEGLPYQTYAASYDQFFEELNVGFGLLALTDDAGNGLFQINKLGAFFSYKVKVNDEFNLKLGVEAGAWQTRVGWDQLIFGDQIDRVDGSTDGMLTEELIPDDDSKTVFDVSAGLLAYGPKFYGGISLKHINTPNDSHLAIEENVIGGLPIRFSFHGGSQITLREGNSRRLSTFISPNILFENQSDLSQLNIGTYAGLGPVFAGAWFRHTFGNSDAVIFLVGYRQKALKIGYSYDLTVSDPLATLNTGGTHEISIGLNFDHNRRKVNYEDCFQLFR